MADKIEIFTVTSAVEQNGHWVIAGMHEGEVDFFYTEFDPQVFPGDRLLLTGTEAGQLKSITWPDGRVSMHYPLTPGVFHAMLESDRVQPEP